MDKERGKGGEKEEKSYDDIFFIIVSLQNYNSLCYIWTRFFKKFKRPPAKLFDSEKIRAIGGEITSDGDFFVFEGNRYSRKLASF